MELGTDLWLLTTKEINALPLRTKLLSVSGRIIYVSNQLVEDLGDAYEDINHILDYPSPYGIPVNDLPFYSKKVRKIFTYWMLIHDDVTN